MFRTTLIRSVWNCSVVILLHAQRGVRWSDGWASGLENRRSPLFKRRPRDIRCR